MFSYDVTFTFKCSGVQDQWSQKVEQLMKKAVQKEELVNPYCILFYV